MLTGERGADRLVGELGALQVPATVQAVLAARIDRLPLDEKLLLQSAAVIGSDVPQALLEAIVEIPAERVGRALASLRDGGISTKASLFPDVVYRFKSALTRDVGYASLLREQRRILHARTVDAIERLYHERTSHADQLAFHASRGEAWAKALPYNRQVGLRAALHAANAEAVRAFQEALTALRHLPETLETVEHAIDLRLDLCPPLLQLGRLEEVLAVSREAKRPAIGLGDEPRLARAHPRLEGQRRPGLRERDRHPPVPRLPDSRGALGYEARGTSTRRPRLSRKAQRTGRVAEPRGDSERRAVSRAWGGRRRRCESRLRTESAPAGRRDGSARP